jgi:predicted SAM-dependent methyltransferase
MSGSGERPQPLRSTWPGDPTAHCLRPPSTAVGKALHYARRYGVLHASCATAGRWIPLVWRLTGPAVSRPDLRRWLGSRGPKRINLGGGSLVSDDWLCADVDPRADVYVDIRVPLRIPDSSIDAIFLEEVIEHVALPEGTRLLSECTRILKPGGRLRLSTPDLDYFAEQCLREPDGPARINEVFYGHGHEHLYTPSEMKRALEDAGFVSIARSWYRNGRSELARYDSHPARFGHAAEISQYWDARRTI